MQQLLGGPEGPQVLAPFGFVSMLAGALLASSSCVEPPAATQGIRFNYWRVSRWAAPVMALRQSNHTESQVHVLPRARGGRGREEDPGRWRISP